MSYDVIRDEAPKSHYTSGRTVSDWPLFLHRSETQLVCKVQAKQLLQVTHAESTIYILTYFLERYFNADMQKVYKKFIVVNQFQLGLVELYPVFNRFFFPSILRVCHL